MPSETYQKQKFQTKVQFTSYYIIKYTGCDLHKILHKVYYKA